MPENFTSKTAQHDPELEGTLAALENLARAERAEPDDAFASRIAASTRPGVIARVGDSRSPVARWWWAAPLAAAAALAIAVLPGRFSSTPSEPTMTLASVESDLEAFLFIDELAESNGVLSERSLRSDSDESAPADELIFDLLTDEGSTL